MKILKNHALLTAAVLCLIFTALLCLPRLGTEAQYKQVVAVMSQEDAAQLSGLPENLRIFDGGNVLDGSLLLCEDENQYANRLMGGESVGQYAARTRCFYLYPQFAARYGTLGYEGAEEIENILYRAATDRNARVLWLTPFTDAQSGELIRDPAVYDAVLDNLAPRLARQGLALGAEFSSFEGEAEPNDLYILALLVCVGALALALIFEYFHIPQRWWLAAGIGLALLCFAAWLLLKRVGLLVPVAALGCSVLFPCLALVYVLGGLGKLSSGPLSRELGGYLRLLLGGFLIALLGGLVVGGLQSSTEFLLANENFRGVKLSQILPLLFAAVFTLWKLCPPREILRGRKLMLILAAALLVLGVGYYILRTGNAAVGVAEQRFRNLLEHILLVRPRTKEFLIAWPCLAVAAALIMRGGRAYCWPFAILSAAGFASVVNTFCHSRAPLWLSCTRSVLGLIIGAVGGCLIVIILHKKEESHAG